MCVTLVLALMASAADARPLGALARPAVGHAHGVGKPEVAGKSPEVPRTPSELPQCKEPLRVTGELPKTAGETIRYHVDVEGLSVGTIDFKIERQGSFGGQQVTEYRSLFKLDSMIAGFVPVEGRAASLVADVSHAPVSSTNRYKAEKTQYEEDVTYAGGGKLTAKRVRNGEAPKNDERNFVTPALDFVSAYYAMRSFPADTNGCALLYANQRAYTIWVKHVGIENVKTPTGTKPADKYELKYASERASSVFNATIWMATDASRLPYVMKVDGKKSIEARVHMYELPAAKKQ